MHIHNYPIYFIAGSFFEESEVVATEKKEPDVPSIPAVDDINASCGLCQEKFIKFFDQEQEEWMYRDAVRYNHQIYHGACFKDFSENVN